MKITLITAVLGFSAASLFDGVIAMDNKAFDVVKRAPKRPATQTTELLGEAHGKSFDDANLVANTGSYLSFIKLTGCDDGQHLSSIEPAYEVTKEYETHGSKPNTFYKHGSTGAGFRTIDLTDSKYVTEITVTTWRAKTGFAHRSKRTRIGSISFLINTGDRVQCGSKSSSDPSKTWKFDGYKFHHFIGSAGDAIDALQAVFKLL